MSDEPILLFRKVLGGLRPGNAAAIEALAKIDDKPIRVRITRTNGNTRRNALYWSCLGVAAENLPVDGLNAELLHRILKDRAGLVKLVRLPSGDTIKDYESTSFAKMAEPERARFIDWSLNTLSRWLGVEVQTLLDEGAAA